MGDRGACHVQDVHVRGTEPSVPDLELYRSFVHGVRSAPSVRAVSCILHGCMYIHTYILVHVCPTYSPGMKCEA